MFTYSLLLSLGHKSIICFRKISIKQLKWLGCSSVAVCLPKTYGDLGSISGATKKQEKNQVMHSLAVVAVGGGGTWDNGVSVLILSGNHEVYVPATGDKRSKIVLPIP